MLKPIAAVAMGTALLTATPGDAFSHGSATVDVTFEAMQLVDAIPADRRPGLAYTTGIADP